MTSESEELSVAQRLSEWCVAQRSVALPQRLTAQVRRHILDALAAGIAGADHRVVRTLCGVLNDPGDSPVLVDLVSRSPASAATINAVAIHALEIDDTEGCDHSAAVTIPAALAALDVHRTAATHGTASLTEAEPGATSARELARAVVLGYEVGRRVQSALGGYAAHNDRGWHSTATCGVFAAAVAAATVLRLPADAMTSAIGLAASSAAGTWVFAADPANPADSKRLHPGHAASTGLRAAVLAGRGLAGPTRVFDDVWGGFLRTYAGPDAAPHALLAGLGTDWAFEHSAIKPYASCRSAHSAIDAVLSVLAEGDVSAPQIERIEVLGTPLLGRMVFPELPTDAPNPEVTRMSLPYSLGLALTGRSLMPDSYATHPDPEVLEWAGRVRFVPDPGRGASEEPLVTVKLRDGRTVHRQVDHPRGSAQAALADSEVENKFDLLTSGRICSQRSAAIKAACELLDSDDPITTRRLFGLGVGVGVD